MELSNLITSPVYLEERKYEIPESYKDLTTLTPEIIKKMKVPPLMYMFYNAYESELQLSAATELK